jgi:DNA-binding response OmpR family regulator
MTALAEAEALRDRIEELEGLLGLNLMVPGDLKLSPILRKLLGLLLKGRIISREFIFTALYAGRPESNWPDEQVITVQISKLRGRLKPHGIEITTHWGTGFSMSPEDIAKAKVLIGEGT